MLKNKQYYDWFAHSGCQLAPQDMMNFWLLPNNQTKTDPLYLSLLLPASHPLLFPLPVICSPKERRWHLRMMNSFNVMTFLLRTSHPPSCPRPCRWDRDRWRYFAMCVHVWVTMGNGGRGCLAVTQWNWFWCWWMVVDPPSDQQSSREINPDTGGLLESSHDRPWTRGERQAGRQTDGADGFMTMIYLLRLCPYIYVCNFQV